MKWVLLVMTGVGCAAGPVPPATSPPATPPRATAKPAIVTAPASSIEQLGIALGELSGVTLRSAESACAAESAAWVTAGDGIACVITDAEEHCVGTRTTDPFELERLLCEDKAAPATLPPPWTTNVATFVRAHRTSSWDVEPVASTPELPALRVSIDGVEHALVRIAGRWRPLITPLAQSTERQRIIRAFDASALAGQTAIAVIHEGYDGGSEQGVHTSFLDVLCDSPPGLRTCGSIQIGSLAWALAAEDRQKYPGAATSLRSRPHVEVLLTPSIRFPGRLHLALEISRFTATLGPELEEPVRALTTVAGEWRLDHGTFVKVN